MIPWWAKVGAKLIISRLPLEYAVWRQLGVFRSGEMEDAEYAASVFASHMKKAGLTGRLQGKTILELGPGDSIATAILAAHCGARAILVDSSDHASRTLDAYRELNRALKREWPCAVDLSHCRSIEDVLEVCRAKYMTDGLDSLRQIESESIDLIFSQAVLEHVRKNEFQEMIQETYRILQHGGVCSHQIDLRDHLGGALNNLRFGEKVWESKFFSNSGFYTNRIQFGRMIAIFEESGFEVECANVQRWKDLPTPRRKLNPQFRNISDRELLISIFDVLLRKKSNRQK